jgi:hypothetical protein
MRVTMAHLRQALRGQLQPAHPVLLRPILAHSDWRQTAVAPVEGELQPRLQPDEQAVRRRQTMPGVKAVAAATRVAELGTDRRQIPSSLRRATAPPGRRSAPVTSRAVARAGGGKTRRGPPGLNAVRCAVAWANARRTTSSRGAQFPRLTRRRGVFQALIAGAHSGLVSSSHVLQTGRPGHERGPDAFDKREQTPLERHHVHQLEQLGYAVTLSPKGIA